MSAPAHRGRRDNGLSSEAFSPVADLDPRLGDHLLDVLGLREIPAYVEPAPASVGVVAERLYVDSALTTQAHGILRDLANELGIEIAASGERFGPRAATDLLDGVDTDAEFAAIVAAMPDLDRPLADSPGGAYFVASSSGDAPVPVADDEVEHFVPPPPPPIPRFTAATMAALLVTIAGIAVLAVGGMLGLPTDLPLPLGVLLILFGCGLLFRRLRAEPPDGPDDGAVV